MTDTRFSLPEVIGWYLELGEYVMDVAQVFLGRSGYFTREIK